MQFFILHTGPYKTIILRVSTHYVGVNIFNIGRLRDWIQTSNHLEHCQMKVSHNQQIYNSLLGNQHSMDKS